MYATAMRAMVYLRLILDLMLRSYTLRFAGSYLGLLWSILVPLLSAGVMAVVFSFLVGAELGPTYAAVPYGLFYFAGFSVWVMMSEVVSRCTTVIVENGALITKISFPVTALPWSVLLTGLVTFLVLTVVTGLWMVVEQVPLGPNAPIAALYLLLAVIATMGVGYMAAAVGVFIRDLGQAVPILLNIVFFLSPITYSPDMVRAKAPSWAMAVVYDWNPVGRIVDGYRSALLSSSASVDFGGLSGTALAAIVVYAGGRYCFRALRPSFADVL